MTRVTPNGTTVAERWTYAGRREGSKGTLVGIWIDARGQRVAFKCQHRAIGAVYEVPDVKLDDDGRSLKAGVNRARYLEPPAFGDERVAGWQADDRTAYTADTARKQEAAAKRAGADRFGELTLNELRDRYITTAAPQRAALLANVLRYLGA